MTTRRPTCLAFATIALALITPGWALAQGGTPAKLPRNPAGAPPGLSQPRPILRTRTLLPPRPATPGPARRPSADRPNFISPGRFVYTPGSGVLVDRGPRVAADGVTVRGRVGDADDDFRLAFRVGPAAVPVLALRDSAGFSVVRKYPVIRSPGFLYSTGTGWVNGWYSGWGWSDYGRYRPVYGSPPQTIDPTLVPRPDPSTAPVPPAPPPVPLTPREEADRALRLGFPDEAISAYRQHLRDEPTDAEAMRLLAIALLDDAAMDEAVAVTLRAYQTRPIIAGEPVNPDQLAGDARDLRRRVERAVLYAHRNPTSAAWLLVATLMQAEGRDELAGRMVERALGLGGLGPELEKALREAYRIRPEPAASPA